MKKIKILTCFCALVLVVIGALCLTACTFNSNNENKSNDNENNQKEFCTVSYDLNFKDSDYSILKSCLDNGLSFSVDGFVEKSNIIEEGNVSIIYTKEIELGRGFILYEFKDKVLNNYFDGWYTYSGIRVDEINSKVNNDITLYAKWKEDLKSLTAARGNNFEYEFDENNKTASFKNADSNMNSNGTWVIYLPELVFNNGKFYVVNNISYNSSRERTVYHVPKTYTGSKYYPIIFPNEDELDNDITYLGDYISQRNGYVICIYKANYTTNTLTLMHLERGDGSGGSYLTLGKDITLTRDGEDQKTLKITNFYNIYPGLECNYTKFIISKDANVTFPIFTNVLENNNNNPIDVFFEFTKDEVEQIDSSWIERTEGNITYDRPAEEIYYYSETEPSEDGYNYWHYVNGLVVVW